MDKILRVERVLKQHIFKDLANKGRANYDLAHTKAVVSWMKRLLEQVEAEFDPLIMISAAYAHDWGYAGLFAQADSDSYEDIQQRKKQHMRLGAIKIERFLSTHLNKYFSQAQIFQVAHLVEVHDLLEQEHAEDEVLLIEADTLGMLDVDRVKPTFSPADEQQFMLALKKRRLPHFIHPFAIDQAEKLYQKRLDFYKALVINN